MKAYSIKRVQKLPTTIDKAWSFFSRAENLSLITPGYMNFKIIHRSGGDELFAGQTIHYTVCILPGLPVNWLTEITDVQSPYSFVDEQRKGPYKIWRHLHAFKEVSGGVEMTDEVDYAIPFGFIGRLANEVFVERRVNAIFDYRFKALEELFKDEKTKIRRSAYS
ncbi:MAG TPA: SRPBCC family protein [Chryseolinea sp.]